MANFYGQYIGFGSGGVAAGFVFQGSNYGYSIAGYRAGPVTNIVDNFSFASGTQDASDVGDLLYSAQGVAGGRSETHGYACGGESALVHINKWSFAAGGDAGDVADLYVGRALWTNSASDGNHCYQAGGEGGGSSYRVDIDRFSVTADSNATDVGDLAQGLKDAASHTSTTHAYVSGGRTGSGTTRHDMVQRWSFAETTDAADTTQNLDITVYSNAGSSSTTHGYSHGGHTSSANVKEIYKFQFDTSDDSTEVGDLTQTVYALTGASSTTHGYRMGGATGYINVIDRYAFASDGYAADVGDLSAGSEELGGTHY